MNFLLKTPKTLLNSWILLISIAFIGGLSFEPFHQPIAFFCSFYGLFSYLYQEQKIASFFKKALVFHFFYFLSQLYWVAWAVKVFGAPSLMPLIVVFLPLILSVFPAFCLLPSFYYKTRISFAWIAGIGLWLSEVLRSFLFTGFPWNLSGYIWDLCLLQSVRFFGILGLSLLTILAVVVLFAKQRLAGAAVFFTLFILWSEGFYRLQKSTRYTNTTVRLVQPCIPQEHKWRQDCFLENLHILETLTKQPEKKPIDITIWPESALPLDIDNFPDLKEHLSRFISRGVLITGAIRREHNPEKVFNSMYVLFPNEKAGGFIFDKSHLVPFGEYVPLKKLNPFPKLTEGTLDYSSGSGSKTITIPGIYESFSPLICYEAVFSGAVIDSSNRPHWLLNITNDSWYGVSSGPYQHLKIVLVRAIEEGLPLVRVANNGISAVIDSYGRITSFLGLNEFGHIDSHLPICEKTTIYRKFLNIFCAKSC